MDIAGENVAVVEKVMKSVAYCGLLCCMCQPEDVCSCRGDNNRCSKRLSEEGCYQYTCCTERGIEGCWACKDAPCGKDMLAEGRVKMRAFIRCIIEDGLRTFARYIARNEQAGIVYHRDGTIFGDYDLETEEQVLCLLREGKSE